MSGERGAGQAHRKLGNDRGEDSHENSLGSGGYECGDPAGGENNERTETRRKGDKPNNPDQRPAELQAGGKSFKLSI